MVQEEAKVHAQQREAILQELILRLIICGQHRRALEELELLVLVISSTLVS